MADSTYSSGKIVATKFQRKFWQPGPIALLVGDACDLFRHVHEADRNKMSPIYVYEKVVEVASGLCEAAEAFYEDRADLHIIPMDIERHNFSTTPVTNIDADFIAAWSTFLVDNSLKEKLGVFFFNNVKVVACTFPQRGGRTARTTNNTIGERVGGEQAMGYRNIHEGGKYIKAVKELKFRQPSILKNLFSQDFPEYSFDVCTYKGSGNGNPMITVVGVKK